MGDLFGHISLFSRGHYSSGQWVQTSAPSKWGSDGFGGYGSWESLANAFAAKGIKAIADGFEFPAFNVPTCKDFCRVTLGVPSPSGITAHKTEVTE